MIGNQREEVLSAIVAATEEGLTRD